MRIGAIFLFSLSLSWMTVASCAQNRPEIFTLRYLSAEEIMPVIRPMLTEPCSLSGLGLVKTDPVQRAALTRLIRKPVREPRNLSITVRQNIEVIQASEVRPAYINSRRLYPCPGVQCL